LNRSGTGREAISSAEYWERVDLMASVKGDPIAILESRGELNAKFVTREATAPLPSVS
jgi:hypothetical protein